MFPVLGKAILLPLTFCRQSFMTAALFCRGPGRNTLVHESCHNYSTLPLAQEQPQMVPRYHRTAQKLTGQHRNILEYHRNISGQHRNIPRRHRNLPGQHRSLPGYQRNISEQHRSILRLTQKQVVIGMSQ